MRSETANREAKARKLLRAMDAAATRYGLVTDPAAMLRTAEAWDAQTWQRVAQAAGYPVDCDPPRTSIPVALDLLGVRIAAFARLRASGCAAIESRALEYAACQYVGDQRAADEVIDAEVARCTQPAPPPTRLDPHLTRSGRIQRCFGDEVSA